MEERRITEYEFDEAVKFVIPLTGMTFASKMEKILFIMKIIKQ